MPASNGYRWVVGKEGARGVRAPLGRFQGGIVWCWGSGLWVGSSCWLVSGLLAGASCWVLAAWNHFLPALEGRTRKEEGTIELKQIAKKKGNRQEEK
jgi:hypothetical protein